jgi:hypothetical protein
MKKYGILGAILAIALTVAAVVAPASGPSAPGSFNLLPQAAFAASNYGISGTSAKTAAYSITAADNGSCFTNRGASGSVTLTLPAPFANAQYLVLVHAAQTFVVAADAVDTLVTYNDAAADSASSNTVGAAMWIWSDGTSWFLIPCTVGVTYTVNT